MSGVIAIVAYRPNPGQDAAVEALIATHVPTLRAAGFVTARAPVIAKAKDGVIVEVFEWESEKAIELAHSDEIVRALWEQLDEICENVPLAELAEATDLFASFAAAC